MMKYINDFETEHYPRFEEADGNQSSALKSVVRAVRCMKCSKIKFANYDGFDYECMRCRIKISL